MSLNLLLMPLNKGVGLISVALGLYRALDEHGVSVTIFNPISTPTINQQEINKCHPFIMGKEIPLETVQYNIANNHSQDTLETIINNLENNNTTTEITIVLGLPPTPGQSYVSQLNIDIAQAINAKIIIINAEDKSKDLSATSEVEIAQNNINQQSKILGYIINKIPPASKGSKSSPCNKIEREQIKAYTIKKCVPLGLIPTNPKLLQPRVSDVAKKINAHYLSKGESDLRRVAETTLIARHCEHSLDSFTADKLIITASDRIDIILTCCLASQNGTRIAGLILTGQYKLSPDVLAIMKPALDAGLPLLSVEHNSFETALLLRDLDKKISFTDIERVENVQAHVSSFIDIKKITKLLNNKVNKRLSPAAFRHALIKKASAKPQRIVLPEGEEARTIHAASLCAEKQIAHCLLLGKKEIIHCVAENQGVQLHDSITIIDPEAISPKLLAPLITLRQHKGMTELLAKEYLKDPVVVGTMMLQQGQVDGLVSGATHTTANTIRPALQLIKTAPHAKLVSSLFFMCLPTQVLVYADCAVNPDPNAEQLADIAIQSADSAQAFGIEPRVAMISYSTGVSGKGADVEKVRHATLLVQQRRPDIIIDGPLQYDAALIESVAKTKAPQSLVAGKATVFIFPDLNTGNTTYKAVQRAANVLSIGPMLQGLNKAVNDLSRGASVDDIVFTIALTAIQAQDS